MFPARFLHIHAFQTSFYYLINSHKRISSDGAEKCAITIRSIMRFRTYMLPLVTSAFALFEMRQHRS